MAQRNAASRPLDRTRLSMIEREDGVRCALDGISAVQNQEPEIMVAGVALMFAAVCNRTGVDPEDMHRLGMKLMRTQEGSTKTNNAVQSLRDFAGLRIAGQDISIS